MTEEQLDFLTDLKNRFWHEFSSLCDRYIQEAADRYPDLTDAATMMLGESTSIYGRKETPEMKAQREALIRRFRGG